MKEFDKLGEHIVWLTISPVVLVSWGFTGLEQAGESTENPFEGGAIDTPVTSMSRTIDIALRDMLDDPNLPPVLAVENDTLM